MRSLGLLLVAFMTVAAVEGCGSDSNTGKKADSGIVNAGGSAGTGAVGTGGAAVCTDAKYCPAVNGAPPCCVSGQCGYNAGNGCIPSGLKPDAGAH
ncbi:MAG TPA: hypothetical protein VHU80_18530 [Polyangiaceae bacterium]|nr:hypothetical protein [Polyangiaceae bacterium]